MSGLDAVMASGLALAVILGFRWGLVLQLVSVLGFVLAYIVAFLWYDDATPFVASLLPMETFEQYPKYAFVVETLKLDKYLAGALAFAALFAATKVALTALGSVLSLAAKVPGLNGINRLGGALLAAAEVLLLELVALHIMAVLPDDRVQAWLGGSQAAPYLLEHIPLFFHELLR